jgi:hypothetical protein
MLFAVNAVMTKSRPAQALEWFIRPVLHSLQAAQHLNSEYENVATGRSNNQPKSMEKAGWRQSGRTINERRGGSLVVGSICQKAI